MRAGRATGLADQAVPLPAFYRSTPLTADQLKEVVGNLTANGSAAAADGVIDGNEIAEKISELTHRDSGPENVRRVAATLAAAASCTVQVIFTPAAFGGFVEVKADSLRTRPGIILSTPVICRLRASSSTG